MSWKNLEQLILHGMEYADHYISFAFQGGEPTLAGIDFFRRVIELQKRYNTKQLTVENTIQTNGILLDEEWAGFLSEHDFLVGLSLDGPRKIHDRYRTDASGRPTFERVMHTVKLLERYHVKYNILSVVTNESVTKASYLYHFYKRNGFRFVQLIPCINEEGRALKGDPSALQADKYGIFLCEMFDLWYADFCRGEQMEIRMFSNLAQMAAGYPAEECGMNGHCCCYFVVEGDGSVYPCDFFCMDQWKLGTVSGSFQAMAESAKAGEFIRHSLAVSEKCRKCPHFFLCRGGCRRWREHPDHSVPGLNILCPAYERFFAYAGPRLQRLGRRIRSVSLGSAGNR